MLCYFCIKLVSDLFGFIVCKVFMLIFIGVGVVCVVFCLFSMMVVYCFYGIENGIYFCICYDWVNRYLYLIRFVGQYVLINFIGDGFGILLIYIEQIMFVGVGVGVVVLGLYVKFIIE